MGTTLQFIPHQKNKKVNCNSKRGKDVKLAFKNYNMNKIIINIKYHHAIQLSITQSTFPPKLTVT